MKLDEIEKLWLEIQEKEDNLLDTAHFAWKYVLELLKVAKAAKLANELMSRLDPDIFTASGHRLIENLNDSLEELGKE